MRLLLDIPMFTAPDKLVRVLGRDLKAAGIAKPSHDPSIRF